MANPFVVSIEMSRKRYPEKGKECTKIVAYVRRLFNDPFKPRLTSGIYSGYWQLSPISNDLVWRLGLVCCIFVSPSVIGMRIFLTTDLLLFLFFFFLTGQFFLSFLEFIVLSCQWLTSWVMWPATAGDASCCWMLFLYEPKVAIENVIAWTKQMT